MKPLLAAAFAVATASLAQAHEGHGMTGSHWHASDAWGFAVLAVIVAVWFVRRR